MQTSSRGHEFDPWTGFSLNVTLETWEWKYFMAFLSLKVSLHVCRYRLVENFICCFYFSTVWNKKCLFFTILFFNLCFRSWASNTAPPLPALLTCQCDLHSSTEWSSWAWLRSVLSRRSGSSSAAAAQKTRPETGGRSCGRRRSPIPAQTTRTQTPQITLNNGCFRFKLGLFMVSAGKESHLKVETQHQSESTEAAAGTDLLRVHRPLWIHGPQLLHLLQLKRQKLKGRNKIRFHWERGKWRQVG